MITSTANAQVKALSKLIKNARARRQQQLYVVEGIRMFRETPKERIGKVYVSESFAKEHEYKNGYVMWPVRTAVSGKQMTPGGATELMELLGKEESLKRINDAIAKLEAALA